MGAATSCELEARPDGDGVEIRGAQTTARVRMPPRGPVVAHLRSESARLGPSHERAAGRLMLRGRITLASYPGGFYRYAVAVGQNQFMVDDTRRLAVGEPVGIGLPVSSLHFFSRREA
jgi:hypothetical protein